MQKRNCNRNPKRAPQVSSQPLAGDFSMSMRTLLVILSLVVLLSCDGNSVVPYEPCYLFVILNAPDSTFATIILDGDTIVNELRRYNPSWSVSYAEAFNTYEGYHSVISQFPDLQLNDSYAFEAKDSCTVGIFVDSTVTFWYMQGILGLE